MWRIHHNGRVSDLVNLARAKEAALDFGRSIKDDTPTYTAETIDANRAWLDAIQPRPLLPEVDETVSAPQPPVMSPAVITLLEDDGYPSGIPPFLRRAAT
jgi:hypothetical protein